MAFVLMVNFARVITSLGPLVFRAVTIMEFLGVWAPLARGRILVVGSADVF